MLVIMILLYPLQLRDKETGMWSSVTDIGPRIVWKLPRIAAGHLAHEQH
jgi:hypothetical protein